MSEIRSDFELDISAALDAVSTLQDALSTALEAAATDLQQAIVDVLAQISDAASGATEGAQLSLTLDTGTAEAELHDFTQTIDQTDATIPVGGDAQELLNVVDDARTAVEAEVVTIEATADATPLETGVADAITAVESSATIDVPVTADATDAISAVEDQVSSATEAQLPVSIDTTLAETGLQDFIAVAEADQATVPISADAQELLNVVDAARTDAEGTPITIPLEGDTTGLEAGVQGAIASIESQDQINVAVEADTESATNNLDALGGSLEQTSGKADQASGSLKVLEHAATGFGVATGLAEGKVGELGGVLGETSSHAGAAVGAVAAVAAAVGLLFSEGEKARAAEDRLNLIFGEQADKVKQIDIGGLKGSLEELAVQAGSTGPKLEQAAAKAGQLAQAAHLGNDKAVEFAQGVSALALRAVALNPSLGDAGDAANRLELALGRGGFRLINYGISLSAAEIKQQALKDSLGDTTRAADPVVKAYAGMELAIQKVGDKLGGDFAKGTQQAAVQLKAVRAEIEHTLEVAGAPLVDPILALLKSVIPLAGTVAQALGALGAAVVPAVIPIVTVLEDIGQTIISAAIPALTQLKGPISDLGSAAAELLKSLEPIAEVVAALLGPALSALAPVLDLVATGLSGIAGVISHIPGPVLAAAAAFGFLTLQVSEMVAADGAAVAAEVALTAVTGALESLINPVTIVIAGVAALGLAMDLFGHHTSAADKEAKDFASTMIDIAGKTTIFKNGVTNATGAFNAFLVDQEKAGKLKDLDKILDGSGKSLTSLAAAIGGTNKQFSAFVDSTVHTDKLNAIQKSFLGLSKAELDVTGAAQGLTEQQIAQAEGAQKVFQALQAQKQVFDQTAKSTIEQLHNTGQLTDAQYAHALAVETSTGALGGYGAALDFANTAIQINTEKTDAAGVKALETAKSQKALRDEIISGALSGTAAQQALVTTLHLSTDAAKAEVTQLQTSVANLTKTLTGAIPQAGKVFSDFASTAATALSTLQKDTHDKTGNVKADLLKLQGATDPKVLLNNLLQQTIAIGQFTRNIGILAKAGLPDLVKQLGSLGATAGGATAQALVDHLDMAKTIEGALRVNDAVVAQQTQVLSAQAIKIIEGVPALGPALANKLLADFQLDPKKGLLEMAAALQPSAPGPRATERAAAAAGNAVRDSFKFEPGPAIRDGLRGAESAFHADRSVPAAAKVSAAAAQTAYHAAFAPHTAITQELRGAEGVLHTDRSVPSAAGTAGKKATDEYNTGLKVKEATGTETAAAAKAMNDPKVPAGAKSVATAATTAFNTSLNLPGGVHASLAAVGAVFGDSGSRILAANEARHAGMLIGGQFDKGIAQGISSGTADIAAAADAAAAAADVAARLRLKQNSPSLVGVDIGAGFTEGIVLGVTSTTGDVTTASTDLATALVDSAANVTKAFQPDLRPGVRAAISQAQTAFTVDRSLPTRAAAVAIATRAAFAASLDLGTGARSAVASVAAVFSDASAQQRSVNAARVAGRQVGAPFSTGIAEGIRTATPAVALASTQASAAATAAAAARLQTTKPGVALGASFVDGITAGVRASAPSVVVAASNIATLLGTSIPRISVPSGIFNVRSLTDPVQRAAVAAGAAFQPDLRPGVRQAVIAAANLFTLDRTILTSGQRVADATRAAFTSRLDLSAGVKTAVASVASVFGDASAQQRAANAARTVGRSIGTPFTTGISDGITAGTPAVGAAATRATTAAGAAAKNVQSAQTGIVLGKNFVDGITAGIRAAAPAVVDAAGDVAATLGTNIPKISAPPNIFNVRSLTDPATKAAAATGAAFQIDLRPSVRAALLTGANQFALDRTIQARAAATATSVRTAFASGIDLASGIRPALAAVSTVFTDPSVRQQATTAARAAGVRIGAPFSQGVAEGVAQNSVAIVAAAGITAQQIAAAISRTGATAFGSLTALAGSALATLRDTQARLAAASDGPDPATLAAQQAQVTELKRKDAFATNAINAAEAQLARDRTTRAAVNAKIAADQRDITALKVQDVKAASAVNAAEEKLGKDRVARASQGTINADVKALQAARGALTKTTNELDAAETKLANDRKSQVSNSTLTSDVVALSNARAYQARVARDLDAAEAVLARNRAAAARDAITQAQQKLANDRGAHASIATLTLDSLNLQNAQDALASATNDLYAAERQLTTSRASGKQTASAVTQAAKDAVSAVASNLPKIKLPADSFDTHSLVGPPQKAAALVGSAFQPDLRPGIRTAVAAAANTVAADRTIATQAAALATTAQRTFAASINLGAGVKTAVASVATVFGDGTARQTAVTAARQTGVQVGVPFATGISLGITQATSLVSTSAARAAAAATTAARASIQSTRAGVDIGNSFVSGIVLGVRASTPAVVDAAGDVASTLVAAVPKISVPSNIFNVRSLTDPALKAAAATGAAFRPDLTPGIRSAVVSAANQFALDRTIQSRAAASAVATRAAFTSSLDLASGVRASLSTVGTAFGDPATRQTASNSARLSGRLIGAPFAQGVAAGIVASTPDIVAASGKAADAASASARSRLQPAASGGAIGKSFTGGIAIGIRQGTPDVVSAAADVSTTLSRSIPKVTLPSDIFDPRSLTDPPRKAAAAASAAFRPDFRPGIQTAVTAAANVLSADRTIASRAQQTGVSIRASFQSGIDLGSGVKASLATVSTAFGDATAQQKAVTAARATGQRIGTPFAQGIGQGVAAGTTAISAAATTAAAAAETAVRGRLKQQAVSTVGVDIGRNFVNGIVSGIKGATPDIARAANSLSSSLTAVSPNIAIPAAANLSVQRAASAGNGTVILNVPMNIDLSLKDGSPAEAARAANDIVDSVGPRLADLVRAATKAS